MRNELLKFDDVIQENLSIVETVKLARDNQIIDIYTAVTDVSTAIEQVTLVHNECQLGTPLNVQYGINTLQSDCYALLDILVDFMHRRAEKIEAIDFNEEYTQS